MSADRLDEGGSLPSGWSQVRNDTGEPEEVRPASGGDDQEDPAGQGTGGRDRPRRQQHPPRDRQIRQPGRDR